jgi:NADPH-dependent curcumin reductase CurA
MIPNKTLIFKKIPTAQPIPGEHLVIEIHPFDPHPTLPPNSLVVKVLYLSLDPYHRGQMRSPDIKRYSQAWTLNQPAICATVAMVLSSTRADISPNDLVCTMSPAAEYAVIPAALTSTTRVMRSSPDVSIPPPVLLSALGATGFTAYASFFEYVKVDDVAGKTIFLSAASGGVGQIVGQLAKMHGMTVVGSVGSKEKADFVVKELGFDHAFVHSEEGTAEALARIAPEGVDVYYDNVGGEQLDDALVSMKQFGRVGMFIFSPELRLLGTSLMHFTAVLCGMISQSSLETKDKYRLKNAIEIVNRRLSVNGFVISDKHWMEKYMAQFGAQMPVWLVQGSIKSKEHVTEGIDNAPQAFVDMLNGTGLGKAVVKVAV